MDQELLQSQVAEQKELADGERGNAAKVMIWRKEIEFAKLYQKDWLKEAETYLKEYQDEQAAARHIWDNPEQNQPESYNIFWANTQTLRPLVFSKLPAPNITQRYFDEDEIARLASEMMERAVTYFLDETDAESVFNESRDDYLITGRGLIRVIFEPEEVIELEETEKVIDENGLEVEQNKTDVDYSQKKICFEFVKFDDVLISTETSWKKLRWMAFKHLMSKDQLTERFGAYKGGRVSLSVAIDSVADATNDKEDVSIFKRAVIWEVWDRVNKKVIWVNETGDEVLLEEIDNPYNLKDFFPTPKFLGISDNPKNLLPIPLYRMYRAQALELNNIDRRCRNLTDQLKFCGLYLSNAESQDIENLFNGDDGQMTPMKKTMGADDIKKTLIFKPILEIATTIDKLEQRKIIIINNIRDITGLSDIVRGVTAPSETATAQELKGNFAISRIQPIQKMEEVFIRNSYRLAAELLVENYSINELAKITNLKIVDADEILGKAKEKLQAMVKEAMQQLNPTAPDFGQKMQLLQDQAKAGYEKTVQSVKNDLKGFAATPDQLTQIDKLIKNDKMRCFTIDVETDSTVKIDQQQEKQDRIEFVKAISGLSSAMFPMVEAGIITPEAFNKFLTFTAAPFKVGRNLQELLIKDDEDQKEKPPTPEQIQQQAESERTQAEIALKQQELQLKDQDSKMDYELGKEKNNIEKARVVKEMQHFDDKIEFDDVNAEADRQAQTAQDFIKQRTAIVTSQIKQFGKGEAA